MNYFSAVVLIAVLKNALPRYASAAVMTVPGHKLYALFKIRSGSAAKKLGSDVGFATDGTNVIMRFMFMGEFGLR